MRRTIVYLLSITLSSYCYCQSTYSKKLVLNGFDNKPRNSVILDDNNLVVPVINVLGNLSTILKINSSGQVSKQILVENQSITGITLFNGRIYGSSVKSTNGIICAALVSFNTDLQDFIIETEICDSLYTAITEGVYKDGNTLYLYGKEILLSTGVSRTTIYGIDIATKALKTSWKFKDKAAENYCFDFQKNSFGNFVYQNIPSDAFSGSQANIDRRIVEINADGDQLNYISFKDGDKDNNALIVLKDGEYLIASEESLFGRFLNPNGFVSKVKQDLTEIDWELKLPTDPHYDQRLYRTSDFLQLEDGSVMACGSVFDEIDDVELDHSWCGFLAKISNDGKLLWLKVYKIPQFYDKGTYGKLANSFLFNLLKAQNGNFVMTGVTALIDSLNIEKAIWILNVDQNGCIEGEECTDIILLDSINKPYLNQNIVTPYTSWVEKFEDTLTGNIQYTKYQFSKDSFLLGIKYYRQLLFNHDNSENFHNTERYFREENRRIYEIHNGVEYKMYDFLIPIFYDTTELTNPITGISLKYMVFKRDSLLLENSKKAKYMDIFCEENWVGNGTGTKTRKWVEGIGDLNGFLSVYDICNTNIKTKMVCFHKAGELLYKDKNEFDCWQIIFENSDLVSTKNNWIEKYYAILNGNIESIRYKFSEDSIYIANHYYKELLYSQFEVGNNFLRSGRFFREASKKVFEYFNFKEFIMYDFNLKYNDYIEIEGPFSNQKKLLRVISDQQDSIILLNGEKRKVYLLTCNVDESFIHTWIEGIGDVNGFQAVYNSCNSDISSTLQCFYRLDTLLYINPESPDCWTTSTLYFQSNLNCIQIQMLVFLI